MCYLLYYLPMPGQILVIEMASILMDTGMATDTDMVMNMDTMMIIMIITSGKS
jgi:hypothetical protein